MEKIILVFYISIEGMSLTKAEDFLSKIVEKSKTNQEDNIISYYIPIKNGETRIECLNPKLISEEDYTNIKNILDKTKQKLDEFLKDGI